MPKKSRRAIVSSRLKAFKIIQVVGNIVASTLTKWKVTRGSWSVTGGSQIEAASNDYALLTAKMAKTDIDLQAWMPGAGTGVAFWVTDSNNWWALVTNQISEDNGLYCTGFYNFNYVTSNSGCGCYSYSYTYYNSYSFSCINNQYCRYFTYSGYICNNNYTVCYGQNGPFTGYGTTCPSPCYASGSNCDGYATEWIYKRRLSVLKSVNNVVTSMLDYVLEAMSSKLGTLLAPNRGFFKVFLRNTATSSPTITAQWWRINIDPVEIAVNGNYTQIGGNLVHTPTGVNVTAVSGIIASPSAYDENLQISDVTITTENLTPNV